MQSSNVIIERKGKTYHVEFAVNRHLKHEDRALYQDLKKFSIDNFRPLFPDNFMWPQRDGLTTISDFECAGRIKSLHQYNNDTFYKRQSKIVRNQIDHWLIGKKFTFTGKQRAKSFANYEV